MHIGEGNIFAAMRLALPEHGALIARRRRRDGVRRPPAYAEDHWEEIDRAVSEALAERAPVRVTVFDSGQEKTWEGALTFASGRLWIGAEGERVEMTGRLVTRVERIRP